jgi:hypothetical protein
MRVLRKTLLVVFMCVPASEQFGAQSPQPSATTTLPRVIPVAGVYTPADGRAPRSVESVTLSIYAEESGGSPIWEEVQSVALDASGRYSILLGASVTEGLPLDMFASGQARWLGLRFERPGEVETPRARLTSVPYALRAADADTLGGRPASAYLLAASARGGDASDSGHAMSAGQVVAPQAVLPGTDNFLAKYTNGGIDLFNSGVYETGGRVGVGTTTPFDLMHVRFTDTAGAVTGYAVQNLGSSATSYSGMLFYDQNGALGQFQGFNNVTHEYRINNIARVSPGGAFNGSINFMIGSSSKLLVGNNAIGIGTTTGTARLNVRANPSFAATGTVSTSSGSSTLTGAGTRFLTELNIGDLVTIGGTTLAVFSVTSDTLASISNNAPNLSGAPMTILPGMLRMQNSAGGLAFQVNSAGNVSIGGGVTSGPTKVYVTDSNRFVGTSTGASGVQNGNVSMVTNTAQAADVGAVLALGGSRGSTGISSFAGIRGAKENGTDAEPSGYLGIYTVNGSSTFAERMRVTSTGRVGIGTTTPATALEVDGGVRVNTVEARPPCNATVRGTFWVTQGGAGVKDAVEVCAKDGSDTFAWRTLF